MCGSPYQAAVQSPDSLEGLNWVFLNRGHRLEAVGANCRFISRASTRWLHRQCTFSLHHREVCMDWSQFKSTSDALADYGQLGNPSFTRQPGMTVAFFGPAFVGSGGCGGLAYKGAKMVQGQRWGVTSYADDAATVQASLAQFGQFRLERQWSGVRR